jgi:hypothetical protein
MMVTILLCRTSMSESLKLVIDMEVEFHNKRFRLKHSTEEVDQHRKRLRFLKEPPIKVLIR